MNDQIDLERKDLSDHRNNKKSQDSPNGKLPPSEMVPDWIKEVWTRLLNFQSLVVESYKLVCISYRKNNIDYFSPIVPYFISTYNTSSVHDICYPKTPEKSMLYDEKLLRFWYYQKEEEFIPFEIMAPKLPSKSYINQIFKLLLEDESVKADQLTELLKSINRDVSGDE
ncbi:MAG: hypothetical protein IH585_20110, partial [Anaerolineaceae bacterium]|nr:hypothetical protein [Anaerolineaceae bacterium]